jgi:hypothetical protein
MALVNWVFGIFMFLLNNPILVFALLFIGAWWLIIMLMGWQWPSWLYRRIFPSASVSEILQAIKDEERRR